MQRPCFTALIDDLLSQINAEGGGVRRDPALTHTVSPGGFLCAGRPSHGCSVCWRRCCHVTMHVINLWVFLPEEAAATVLFIVNTVNQTILPGALCNSGKEELPLNRKKPELRDGCRWDGSGVRSPKPVLTVQTGSSSCITSVREFNLTPPSPKVQALMACWCVRSQPSMVSLSWT